MSLHCCWKFSKISIHSKLNTVYTVNWIYSELNTTVYTVTVYTVNWTYSELNTELTFEIFLFRVPLLRFSCSVRPTKETKKRDQQKRPTKETNFWDFLVPSSRMSLRCCWEFSKVSCIYQLGIQFSVCVYRTLNSKLTFGNFFSFLLPMIFSDTSGLLLKSLESQFYVICIWSSVYTVTRGASWWYCYYIYILFEYITSWFIRMCISVVA